MKVRLILAGICLVMAFAAPNLYAAESGQTSDGLYKNDTLNSTANEVMEKPTEAEAKKCKSWPIWTCEPSTFDWEYTQKETCLILDGEVTVSDDADSVSFGPGDMVVFPESAV